MFLGEQYLLQARKDVDSGLDRYLPQESTPPTRLHTAMRYSIFAGGRRFRPALCIASCEAVGGAKENALLCACAIELLHTYSLIHDDLPAMDDDDTRRGKPSSHKAFGEGMAILAGDALLTLAFELLGKTGIARLCEELAQATGSLGTVGGQADDLDSKENVLSKEAVVSIHMRKTAALFRATCRLGAVAAAASEEQVDALGNFGEQLGVAFQLLDDVCDNDPITMQSFRREEVVSLAKEFEQRSYESLTLVQGDTRQLKEIAEYTYMSFAV